MEQGLLDTPTLAMRSGKGARCCKGISKRCNTSETEARNFALPFHSFKFVGIFPDPLDHCSPILATSHYLEGLDTISKSKYVDDAARTRFEAEGTKKRVLDG